MVLFEEWQGRNQITHRLEFRQQILNLKVPQINRVGELDNVLAEFEGSFRHFLFFNSIVVLRSLLFKSSNSIFAMLQVVFVNEVIKAREVSQIIYCRNVLIDKLDTMTLIVLSFNSPP